MDLNSAFIKLMFHTHILILGYEVSYTCQPARQHHRIIQLHAQDCWQSFGCHATYFDF
jgi:hypothetical protein